MEGSLENIESSFICRRCKGELYETRQVNSQVNGLHIDGHEYEIVDKLCYLDDMLSQEGGCEHTILKRTQTTTTNILRPFFPLLWELAFLLPMTGPSISLHPLHHFSPNL